MENLFLLTRIVYILDDLRFSGLLIYVQSVKSPSSEHATELEKRDF
jgi:hypothetical protein